MLRRLLLGSKVQEMVDSIKKKCATGDITSISFNNYFDMVGVRNDPSAKKKAIKKDFGSESYFFFYLFLSAWNLLSREEFETAITVVEYEDLKTFLRARYLHKIGEISEYDFKLEVAEYSKSKSLRNSISTERNNIEFKYRQDVLKANLEEERITQQEYDLGVINIKYDKEIASSPPEHHSEIELLRKRDILKHELDCQLIEKRQYDKEIATLDKRVWYKFNVVLDSKNPSVWEFDIDYNSYFIEWLKENGYELPPSVKEATSSEELDDTLIEYWFKNNMTRISASFLKSEHGDSFRSVVANDPASVIIEELEFDEDKVERPEGMEDLAFAELLKQLKGRRSYR